MHKEVILLSVTGLSPQVVTETLYGIWRDGLDWPNQIKIITTKKGGEQARLQLIVERQIEKLCAEYQLPIPKFDEQDINVAPDAHGQEVDDARTLEDQEALSDFITSIVAKVTENPSSIVHASLAGGRKTMTFFLGYAMTIFGRPQDRLSHVLVSESYESAPDFYFPTKKTRSIRGRDGRSLDAQKAEVTLAEIPFVSQRTLLNESLLKEYQAFGYNGVIQQMQLALSPNQNHVTFIYDLKTPQVKINETVIDFSRHKLEFAFFAMCYRPRDIRESDLVERPLDEVTAALMTKYYFIELCKIANIEYRTNNDQLLIDELIDADVIKERTADSLFDASEEAISMNKSFFDTRANNLKELLQKHFPKALVQLIAPAVVYDKDGNKLERGKAKSQKGFYGTWLTPNQIAFTNSDGNPV